MMAEKKICPNCLSDMVAESIGWKCKNCLAFIDMQGVLHEHKEKPFMPPMTNADRIRAMSDEELERFINHFNICDIRTNEVCKMSYCACCEVCVMDWLKQPAEGE